MKNQKYLAIIYELVKPECVYKLLKWTNIISEENKKGLRVIKTVLDIKGAKRFKKNTGSAAKSEVESTNINQFDLDAAKQTFRKNT